MEQASYRLTRRGALRLIGLGASGALLAACAGPAPQATQAPAQKAPAAGSKQTFAMKIGTATVNDIQHEWAKRYKDRLEKRSNGQITAEVFPASQLGSIPRMIEGVQLGTIEAWMGPPDFLAGVEIRATVPGMPLLFQDMDEAFKVTDDPEVLDKFLALTEPKGIKGVSLVIYGPQMIYDRKPVRTPADMRGRKYRVFASPMEIETMSAWGATGVPMSLGEVVPALQQGTIDGVQTGMVIGDTFKFYDTAKYVTDTNHAMITSFGGVSKVWYDKLPPDLQKAVVEEGRALHKELFDFQQETIEKATRVWVDQTRDGLIQLSDEERNAFWSSLADVPSKVIQQKPDIKDTVDLFQTKVKAVRG